MTMSFRPVATLLVAFSIVVVSGCAAPQKKMTLPAPLNVPPRQSDVITSSLPERPDSGRGAGNAKLQQTPTPTRNVADTATAGFRDAEPLPPMGTAPVSINVENVPIPVFANGVFGEMLGLNVTVEPDVATQQSLVTLRTTEAQQPRHLFELARQVLAEYGVAVVVEGELVKLRMKKDGSSIAPPLIVSGRALPDVPSSHRPVFQLVEMEVVRSTDAMRWLNTLFAKEITVQDDTTRNALLISGKPEQVRQAINALRVFDRPLMRGRVSTRLEPAFSTADQLADRMVEILNVQGYSASRSLGVPSSVMVIPVQTVNSILVFATSQEVLDYAVSWAREIDRPTATAGSQSMFYYQVKNTKAAELARVLGGGGMTSNNSNNDSPMIGPAAAGSNAQGANAPAAAASQPRRTTQGASGFGGLLVDEPRNALIYQGDPAQWERILTLVRQMDRAPRQVMVEVTIAEVTLTDGNQFGIAWFAKNGFDRFNGNTSFGTFPGSGTPSDSDKEAQSNGLTYLLDVAGSNRFALTAFAKDSRVNILSVPRLLVKSGGEANIDIGTEVPTITMTTTSSQVEGGSSNLLQSVQYRKTGIILRIKPTVYSDDRIDLDISQEVSEALPLDESSKISSPSIFNRSLNTSLTLRDGGSVVMAGLMSENKAFGDSGIPLLKDIPVLGNLFKSQNKSTRKTELVLMIVPYIIESDARADTVSQAIVDKLELLELPAAPVPTTEDQPAALEISP